MSQEVQQIDFAVVGGGILGLWCAREILQCFPDASVVVFEKENYLGEHTTGRNSEVLHAGIYYPQNSLKHLHCLEGNLLWRDYVSKKNLTFRDCGKFIVARVDQLEKLEQLFTTAQKNAVPGIRRMTSEETSDLGKHVHLTEGLFSPSSGVLNVSEALQSLQQDIENSGGVILKRNHVKVLDPSPGKFLLEVNGDQIESAHLINCGGLFAVDLRRQLGLDDLENYYVKGSYLKLRKRAELDRLIYPIPPAHGLGLGVHLTLDTAGDQKFGPDTEEVGQIDYSVSEGLVPKLLPSIREVFKNISEEDLILGYAGVRPKIKKSNILSADFIFNSPREHGIHGYFEYLGIESPGITASPSLAKLVLKSL